MAVDEVDIVAGPVEEVDLALVALDEVDILHGPVEEVDLLLMAVDEVARLWTQ